jgi:hypothetical protein
LFFLTGCWKELVMKQGEFHSRVIRTILDVLPVIDHLEDNLNGEMIVVILTIRPKTHEETGYYSIKKVERIKVEISAPKDIRNLQGFLLANWATRKIHVKIQS